MPEGLLGFPDCTRYIFVEDKVPTPLQVFQALDNPGLAFVLINPQIADPNYAITIDQSDADIIELDDKLAAGIFSIVTMDKDINKITANLQGPIIMNMKNDKACQVVLINSQYTTREPIFSREG